MYAGDPRDEARPSRGIFSGVIVIVIAVALLVSLVFTVAYQRCTSEFWREDWLYPGAQVIGETAQFLSTQQRILLTADSAAAVEAWYAGAAARQVRAGVTSGDFDGVPSAPRLTLSADPAGTRIILTRICP